MIKSLVLSVVVLAVSAQVAAHPIAEYGACQEAFVAYVAEVNQVISTNQNERISKAVQNLPTLLSACGLNQVAEKTQISSACISDLSQGINLIQKIFRGSDNKLKLALDVAMFAKLYQTQIKQSCSFLNEVNINFKSSGVCLESAYQLSLTVQTLWQHLTQGNTGAAFKDLETLLDDLPDTLDACGDHALATKIRTDFPAACLKSFEDLGKELVVFEHNFDHLEWLAKHWKELEKVLGEVRTTCPLFA